MAKQVTMITREIEIPEVLDKALQRFINERPAWSEPRAAQAAIALFLLQNGVCDRTVNALYLDSLFGHES